MALKLSPRLRILSPRSSPFSSPRSSPRSTRSLGNKTVYSKLKPITIISIVFSLLFHNFRNGYRSISTSIDEAPSNYNTDNGQNDLNIEKDYASADFTDYTPRDVLSKLKKGHSRLDIQDTYVAPGKFSTATNGERIPLMNVTKPSLKRKHVVNLGLLGTGSSLLAGYFFCGGFSVSHSQCATRWNDKPFNCGECIQKNFDKRSGNILGKCGVYQIHAQLGFIKSNFNNTMYLPQVVNLLPLRKQNPNANFVLTTRESPQMWARAVMDNYLLYDAYSHAEMRGLTKLTSNEYNTEQDLIDFYEHHAKRVKRLFGDRLTIINTDSPTIGEFVEENFERFGVKASCWGGRMQDEVPETKFSISSGGIHVPLLFDEENPPPPKLKLPTPVISVGFPKTATTSMFSFFHCGGYSSSHYRCSQEKGRFRCGDCIQNNIQMGRKPIFKNCGNFDVWAEINVSKKFDPIKTIFLPQVEHLNLIHRDYPNATLFLTHRDPDDWIKSVMNWHELHTYFINSNITSLPAGVGKSKEELRAFFVGHNERIRQFARNYPSHALVEVDIGDKNIGKLLEHAFG
eukprot:CAMPEP_0194291950 /NCGR_PEP_ID=MMETSP0169-20130528/44547_1 /TAXON_ID=218684 /ORGANISM="Corethron pennatum, Strain L29A3" /LENGTH=569 /DNA_ID=CAMNT_0039039981 /DNA_START=154 /DNA_END=1860 /DNA_ORIENTATION=-